MKISVLTENVAGGTFAAEHGLSYFIEHDKNILFDTGHSDIFIQNAKKLNINIEKDTDTVVLSHGHWDHGNGLIHLKKKTLITHPYSYIKRYRKRDKSYIGLNQTWGELNRKFRLISTKQCYNISEKLIFLGEIPKLNDFEANETSFIDSKNNPDFIPDDSGLAIILDDGIAVISGCAHSGICNIIEKAKLVTGINTIKLVMGGFHLKENNEQTQKTIEYFIQNNITNIYPSHCTEFNALAAFHSKFNFKQLKTGMQIIID